MADSVAQRALLRLREEMAKKHLNQTDIAGLLGWKQGRVSKILNGRIGLDVDTLAELCFAVGLSITEVLRDRGLEFCAEMTPTELRILERLRQLPPPVLDAMKTLIQISQSSIEKKGVTASKSSLGKPRR